MVTFTKNFDFNLRRDYQKKFLWASRLWVGRRKEPISGYVPKNNEEKNSGGLRLTIKKRIINEWLAIQWDNIIYALFYTNSPSEQHMVIFSVDLFELISQMSCDEDLNMLSCVIGTYTSHFIPDYFFLCLLNEYAPNSSEKLLSYSHAN